jgi:hypothetical protein
MEAEMRRFTMTLTLALAVLMVAASVPAAESGEGDWEITIRYGKSMTGVGEVPSGEDCAFVWEFSQGRKGVRFLGKEATVNLKDLWSSDSPMQGPLGRMAQGSSRPELVILLSINVEPLGGDRLDVRTSILRWRLTSEPPVYEYNFEPEANRQEIGVGDAWQFLGGRGPDGKEYYLEMTIEPAAAKPNTRVIVRPKAPRLKLNYRFEQRDADTRPVSIDKDIDPGETEAEPVRFEVPVKIKGVDSSAIHVSIKFNDLVVRETGRTGEYEMDAVFELDRMLVVDIVPTDDTTRIEASHLVESGYNHAIHLRPRKRVRIELPSIESSKYPVETHEVIEIEPDVATQPR